MTAPPVPPDVDLEAKIRHALQVRADAYVSDPERSPAELHTRPHREPRSAIAAAALVATIIAAVVLTGALLVRDDSARQETPASDSTTTTTEAPPVAGALNIPLRVVRTSDMARWTLTHDSAVGVSVATYVAGDGPPVTIATSSDPTAPRPPCMAVATWYNLGNTANTNPRPPSPGWTSRCAPANEVNQVFHYPHYKNPDDATVFYAWTQVPPDARYVLLQSDGRLLWQRPLNGSVVFPIAESPIDATLRAMRADGSEAAIATIYKNYNGAQYLPGQPATRMATDPRYPDCHALVTSEDGLTHIFDHGTREAAAMSVAEYCEGQHGRIPGALPYSTQQLQAAGVAEQRTLTYGTFVVSYVELECTNSSGRSGCTHHTDRPLTIEQTEQRVEQSRAAQVGIAHRTLRGRVLLGDDREWAPAGDGRCHGDGRYNDVSERTRVVVRDEAQVVLGKTRLKAGRQTRTGCAFAFRVTATEADHYTFRVGNDVSQQSFDAADLDRAHNDIQLETP